MHLMYSLFADSAFVEGCIWVKSKYGKTKQKTELNLLDSHKTLNRGETPNKSLALSVDNEMTRVVK